MNADSMPLIGIVGRPNVGKSALFNRIVGRRISIVHEQAGVTRDRVMSPASWKGRHFLLADTGGLGVRPNEKKNVDVFDDKIRDQVRMILEEADRLIWVVDFQNGMLAMDEEIARMLRKYEDRVVLAVNKTDDRIQEEQAVADFAKFGFKRIIPVSCMHNFNIDYLISTALDGVATFDYNREENEEYESRRLCLTVVGRPNAGKSSLVNKLLGEERVMVSDIAGTTRDAIDIPLDIQAGDETIPLKLIDTAGLRARRRVDTVVEYFSTMRAQNAIKRADIVLLVVDGTSPGTTQDRKIARMISDEMKPCIIVGNKLDLIRHEHNASSFVKILKRNLPFIAYCPFVSISAKDGKNIDEVIEKLLLVRQQLDVTVPTNILNRYLQDLWERTPPASHSGKLFKLFYATMVGNQPPHFKLFVNRKDGFPKHYLAYLENQLREAFYAGAGFPINMELIPRRKKDEMDKGGRAAVAGIMRKKVAEKNAKKRHNQRRKGYRKRR